MSNPAMKHPRNLSGPWYCTDHNDPTGQGCIACQLCYSNAPEFFTSDEEGFAYVHQQPATPEEIQLCQEQLDVCPVNSIGSDGGGPEEQLGEAAAGQAAPPREVSKH